MPINNIKSVGDDQQWKAEVEREIRELQQMVKLLQSRVESRNR